MFIEQPPWLVRWLYAGALWRMNPKERAVYLTFDDGPIPEVTPWVLDLLDRYGVKATFFLVGDNVRKHPDVFRLVVERGHRVGNHTFNHIRGFEYSAAAYLENTQKTVDVMREAGEGLENGLLERAMEPLIFRPPHGHMGLGQYRALKHGYRIVMWDLVTRDYSKKMRPQQVLDNVKRYVRNGSVITFHDSLKSWNNGNLPYALPRALDYLKQEGYAFRLL